MRLRKWALGMGAQETADLAYWERNLLALRYADGWYNDDENNYRGWRRVLSLDGGKMCFHIPDTFDVGNLPQITPNWDGHSTEEKWARVMEMRGITPLNGAAELKERIQFAMNAVEGQGVKVALWSLVQQLVAREDCAELERILHILREPAGGKP